MTERRRKLVRGLAKLAVVAAALVAVWIFLARQWSAEIRFANAKGMRIRLDREFMEMRNSKEPRRVVPLDQLQPGGWWDRMYILPPGTDPRVARDRIDKGWRSSRLKGLDTRYLVVFTKSGEVVGEFDMAPNYGIEAAGPFDPATPADSLTLEVQQDRRTLRLVRPDAAKQAPELQGAVLP